jgi:hypothetical protein
MAVGHNSNLQQNVDVLGIECIERMEIGLGLDWAFGAEMESLLPSGERNGFVVTTCWWLLDRPGRNGGSVGPLKPHVKVGPVLSRILEMKGMVLIGCVCMGVEPSYPMRESEKLDTCCSSRTPKPEGSGF